MIAHANMLDPGGLRHLEPAFATFQEQHREWNETRTSDSEPLYALPERVIASLADSMLQPQILEGWDEEAERDFLQLCNQFHTIGIWRGRPIGFSPLDPRPATPAARSLEGMRALGWTDTDIQTAMNLGDPAKRLHSQLKGWAGILLSEPAFLKERDDLKSHWASLGDERWEIPLTRTAPVVGPIPRPIVTKPTVKLGRFVQAFDGFCDRWLLAGMATWDLPHPEGPKLAVLGDLHARQLLPQHATVTIPPSLRLPADELRKHVDLAHQQSAVDRNWGLSPDIVSQFDAYGSLLEIGHYEAVIRARYSDRVGPKYYFAGRLEVALADHLLLAVERIQKLHKKLRACRRGNRPNRLG